MKKTNDFTEGSILPKLLGFAFPVLLALFLQAMYGVRIPVAFLTSRRAGVTLFQIGLATPVSSLVQIILCLGYFSMFHKKMLKQAE